MARHIQHATDAAILGQQCTVYRNILTHSVLTNPTICRAIVLGTHAAHHGGWQPSTMIAAQYCFVFVLIEGGRPQVATITIVRMLDEPAHARFLANVAFQVHWFRPTFIINAEGRHTLVHFLGATSSLSLF